MKSKIIIYFSGVIICISLVLTAQASKTFGGFANDAFAIMAKTTMSTQSSGCATKQQHFCYPSSGGDRCMWGPEVGILCRPFEDNTQ